MTKACSLFRLFHFSLHTVHFSLVKRASTKVLERKKIFRPKHPFLRIRPLYINVHSTSRLTKLHARLIYSHQTTPRFPASDVHSSSRNGSVSARSWGSAAPFKIKKRVLKNQKCDNWTRGHSCFMHVSTRNFARIVVTYSHDESMFTFSTFWLFFKCGSLFSRGTSVA